ncbi:hypothetical protein BC939DRAFT_461141 [Gamsiella multidivaricata]|uniref:uncharacterized protein n=1 Tax=Gamsiella multidivaricata TaxID=101098 RepID=UPI00222007F8|nr:uncharacterized protein BC939DRAFT_461141 [Gamsiella multidivaricata]KAI7819095.1 hypothetical protein BC939DRAFT_461141 [Gamsiella multidivaricata]
MTSMDEQTTIIALFSLLVLGKILVLIHLIRRENARKRKARTNNLGAPSGPEVLVEDPMTQRLRSQRFLLDDIANTNGSALSLLTTETIPQPPPAYTTQDLHLEFAHAPPPPSFADLVGPSPSPPRTKPNARRSSGGSVLSGIPSSPPAGQAESSAPRRSLPNTN